MKTGMKIAI